MLAAIWLLTLTVLLVVAWQRLGLSTSSFRRVVLVAVTTGVVLTAGLYLAWWLQPPVNPAGLLVILSDTLLLFPLVAVVGPDIGLIEVLGPVLMAVEVSLLLLLIMGALRWATRVLERSDRHD
jgi:hypothetical protein